MPLNNLSILFGGQEERASWDEVSSMLTCRAATVAAVVSRWAQVPLACLLVVVPPIGQSQETQSLRVVVYRTCTCDGMGCSLAGAHPPHR